MAWRINRLFKSLLIIIIIVGIALFTINTYININYPLSYQSIIYTYSSEFNTDPYLIAAIINVESRYDKNAISHKEARGLMQIAPSTGLWAAEILNIENFKLDMLFEPEINIRFGSWYLDMLSKEFNNDFDLMITAYNGGSGNVGKWLKDKKYSKDGRSLQEIPFKETREYVEKVSKNFDIYRTIYKGQFDGQSVDKEPEFVMIFHSVKRLLKYLVKYK